MLVSALLCKVLADFSASILVVTMNFHYLGRDV